MPLRGVAFVFPGQGSQAVGMGSDLYEAFPEVRALFAEADDALHFPLSRIILEGPENELRQTANTQPAILLVSTAVHRVLGLTPSLVAGHSLGEYSALVAAAGSPYQLPASASRGTPRSSTASTWAKRWQRPSKMEMTLRLASTSITCLRDSC